jgi:NO-binding membrane sensor protein with MHYT domain
MMTGTFDSLLVAVSYAIAVFGSFTGLVLAGQITNLRDGLNRLWLVGAAVALGGGAIWSMHFIGMLAYKLPLPVSYDITLTLVSMLVAILFTGIGVFMVIRRSHMKFGTLIGAGIIMGLGVASMHYTGMAAMIVPAHMHHDHTIVAISVVIAIVASTAALWIAFTMRKGWQKVVSAFVMGAAVCGMHYTAMYGMSFQASAEKVKLTDSLIFVDELAVYITATTFIVLIVSLLAVFANTLRGVDSTGSA